MPSSDGSGLREEEADEVEEEADEAEEEADEAEEEADEVGGPYSSQIEGKAAVDPRHMVLRTAV